MNPTGISPVARNATGTQREKSSRRCFRFLFCYHMFLPSGRRWRSSRKRRRRGSFRNRRDIRYRRCQKVWRQRGDHALQRLVVQLKVTHALLKVVVVVELFLQSDVLSGCTVQAFHHVVVTKNTERENDDHDHRAYGLGPAATHAGVTAKNQLHPEGEQIE